MIDTHIHFWHYQPKEYDWIDDDMPVLQQDRLPKNVITAAKNAGMTGMVAVQARCSEAENDFLLSVAKDLFDNGDDCIKGIVGWLDFCADDVDNKLQHYHQHSLIKGFRHLVEYEPNPSKFWQRQDFRLGVKKALQQNFCYDLLCHQKDLPALVDFAKHCDDNWLVLDHLAKPDFTNQDGFEFWKTWMAKLAECEHVAVKVSGLLTELGQNGSVNDLKRHVLTAIELFGVERVVWGSDWPVVLLSGQDYADWVNVWHASIHDFTQNDKNLMETLNAKAIYRLD